MKEDEIVYLTILILLLLVILSDDEKRNAAKILVIAHRGASSSAPENTFAAIEEAIRLGADYVEIDTQMTHEKEILVIHDEYLSRIANVSQRVYDLSRSQLPYIDAGSWFNHSFRNEQIPLLEDVFKKYKNKTKFLIELKSNASERAVASRIKEHYSPIQYKNNIIVQSFEFEHLLNFHRYLPDLPLGLLTTRYLDDTDLQRISLICKYVNPHFSIMNNDFLSKIRKYNLQSFAWTVNSHELLRKAAELKVEGIVTDYPDWDLMPEDSRESTLIGKTLEYLKELPSFIDFLIKELENYKQ